MIPVVVVVIITLVTSLIVVVVARGCITITVLRALAPSVVSMAREGAWIIWLDSAVVSVLSIASIVITISVSISIVPIAVPSIVPITVATTVRTVGVIRIVSAVTFVGWDERIFDGLSVHIHPHICKCCVVYCKVGIFKVVLPLLGHG